MARKERILLNCLGLFLNEGKFQEKSNLLIFVALLLATQCLTHSRRSVNKHPAKKATCKD